MSEALAQRAPGEVLFGGYWGTYVLVDGTVAEPLLPVVADKQVNRLPWTKARFQTARSVLVSHFEFDRFGPGAAPIPFIYEHGTLLQLETADWLQDGPIHISRYRNVTAQATDEVTVESEMALVTRPCSSEACIPIGPRNPGDEALRVSFPPTRGGRLVIFFGATYDPPASLPAFKVAAINASTPALRVEARGPMLLVDFNSDEPVVGWRVLLDPNAVAQDVPRARAAFLLPREEPSAIR